MVDLKKYFDDQVAEAQEAKGQYDTDLDAAKAAGVEEGHEAGVKEGDVAGYARGLAEGKASIELPDPKDPQAQYTQQQMNDAVSTARDEEKAAANVVVDKMKADLDAQLKVEQDKAAADLKEVQDKLDAAPKAEELEAAKSEVVALRAAIQVEIDDAKQDTERLEAAMPKPSAPVEEQK